MKIKIKHIKICGTENAVLRENFIALILTLEKKRSLKSITQVPISKNFFNKNKINPVILLFFK